MAVKNSIIPGQKFNKLTILCEAPRLSGNQNRRVSALCSCGNAGTFVFSEVFTGRVKSCSRCAHNGPVTHGHTIRKKMSPEYYSWSSMMTRCQNKSHDAYQNYGGRGIYVCERWKLFANFLADMGLRPTETSLDRINNDDGYYKNNCRWATKREQANNRRSNSFYEFMGDVMTISDAAIKYGIAYNTLHARIVRFGWLPDEAVTKAPKVSRYSAVEVVHDFS